MESFQSVLVGSDRRDSFEFLLGILVWPRLGPLPTRRSHLLESNSTFTCITFPSAGKYIRSVRFVVTSSDLCTISACHVYACGHPAHYNGYHHYSTTTNATTKTSATTATSCLLYTVVRHTMSDGLWGIWVDFRTGFQLFGYLRSLL